MEQEVVLLGYSGYDFTSDSGEKMTGAKLSYFTRNGISQKLKQGCLPLQSQVSLDVAQDIQFPCLAKLKFDLVPDSKNKPTMVITSISPINPLDLNILFGKK